MQNIPQLFLFTKFFFLRQKEKLTSPPNTIYNEKKEQKALNKGLHLNARIQVTPIGETIAQREDYIILFATEFYEFIQSVTEREKKYTFFSWKTAGFLSKTIHFIGYSDEEVYRILTRHISRNQKKEERKRKIVR